MIIRIKIIVRSLLEHRKKGNDIMTERIKLTQVNQSSVITIAGQSVKLGESKKIQMPMARLYTDTEMSMPIFVKRAKKEGPTVFVSAAVHGDEINGIEIIRRLMTRKNLL